MNDRPEWFAPKRLGWGAGLPIAWQGWALIGAMTLITTLAAVFLAPRSVLAFVSVVLPALIIFTWVTAQTTRGGWRWRWGNKE